LIFRQSETTAANSSGVFVFQSCASSRVPPLHIGRDIATLVRSKNIFSNQEGKVNITPEQKQKIVGIIVQGLLMMLIAILAVFGWNISIVQPQIAKQAAENAALAKQLADFKASAGIEPAKAEGIGALAVPYNVTTNPVFTKQSGVAALRAWNGGDISVYSDGGSTLKFDVDGATGNTTINGFLRLGAASTISVTNGSVITPTATYQPIQSSGTVTATAIATTGYYTGQVISLINTSNTSIVLTNGTNLKLPGATNLTLGQYDPVILQFDGTRWFTIATSNN
jgi:hypothetical protein